MHWRQRPAWALVLLVLFLAGCTGRRGHTVTAPVTRASTTSTTLDPYAVPETVDVAYVNRVLAALDAADGDLFRLYLKERRISPEIGQRIIAMYGRGGGYDLKVSILEADRDTKFPAEPGNKVTRVTRLITATESCIFAQVERDYRPVAGKAGIPVQWVGLRPVSALNEIAIFNPTHWVYTDDGVLPDLSQPPNPCTHA